MVEAFVYRFLAVSIIVGLVIVVFLKMFDLHDTIFWRDFWCAIILLVLAGIVWECGTEDVSDVVDEEIKRRVKSLKDKGGTDG